MVNKWFCFVIQVIIRYEITKMIMNQGHNDIMSKGNVHSKYFLKSTNGLNKSLIQKQVKNEQQSSGSLCRQYKYEKY